MRERYSTPLLLVYAYHHRFLSLGVPFRGLDFPSPLVPASAAVRVPAVKSLHLLCQLHRPQSLARGYPTNGFPDFDRLSHASFPTCSPVQNQLPSVTILNRTRLSLTLVSFDQVDLTAIADEHPDREHVEQVTVRQVSQRKIKVRRRIHLPDHDAPVCLGSAVVHGIISARFV